MIGVKGKMPQIGAFMVKKMREKSGTTSAFFYGTMVLHRQLEAASVRMNLFFLPYGTKLLESPHGL